MLSKSVLALALGAAFAGPQMADAAGTTGGTAAPAAPKKEREVEKVKMEDGREVEFVGKRKLLKETIIDGSKVAVRLDFRNGHSRLFQVPDGLLLRSAGHGMEQKLGDETAGEEDVDDMVLAVDALIERLATGSPDSWVTKREGGGFGGASLLVKALVEVTGKPIEEVKAFLKQSVEAGTTYQKLNDAFSEDETVGPVIKRLKKEKAGDAKVDTKGLLSGLGAVAAAQPAA